MKDLIERVIQLSNKCVSNVKNNKENKWNGHINQLPIVDAFEQVNIQSAPRVTPQQYTPVWPTLMQPTNFQSAYGLSHINCKIYFLNLTISKSNLL